LAPQTSGCLDLPGGRIPRITVGHTMRADLWSARTIDVLLFHNVSLFHPVFRSSQFKDLKNKNK
jgi:hypothetical protein